MVKLFVSAAVLGATAFLSSGVVAALQQPDFDGDLLLSVELCRHGERQPGYIFDFAVDPSQDFNVPYNLTMTGAQSHYANGQGLRDFFDKSGHFLSDLYTEEEVYVQTTERDRTIDSARAQLDGLFNQPLAWPNVDSQFSLNTIIDGEDFISHLNKDDCPRYAGLLDDIKNDAATAQMLAQIDADLEATLFPELRRMADMPDADTKTMHDLCNYIYWADENSLELTLSLTDEQMNQCNVSYQRKVYQKFDATSQLDCQPEFEYLQVLSEFSQILVNKGSLQEEAPVFTKYANRVGTPRTTLPKFVLYSAHAENVAPAMHVFQHPQLLTPPPASMIVINFYECATCTDDEQYQVVVNYVPQYRVDSSDIEVLFSMTNTEFEGFIADAQAELVQTTGTTDVPTMCSQTYIPPSPRNYSDPEAYRLALYDAFDFHPPTQTQFFS